MQLDLAQNLISTLEGLTPLFSLSLEELNLEGNPVAELPNYRAHLFEKYHNIHQEFPLSRCSTALTRTGSRWRENFKIWTMTRTMMRMTANRSSWTRTMRMSQSPSPGKRNDLFVEFWQIAIFRWGDKKRGMIKGHSTRS
jgi:hypothetical protein